MSRKCSLRLLGSFLFFLFGLFLGSVNARSVKPSDIMQTKRAVQEILLDPKASIYTKYHNVRHLKKNTDSLSLDSIQYIDETLAELYTRLSVYQRVKNFMGNHKKLIIGGGVVTAAVIAALIIRSYVKKIKNQPKPPVDGDDTQFRTMKAKDDAVRMQQESKDRLEEEVRQRVARLTGFMAKEAERSAGGKEGSKEDDADDADVVAVQVPTAEQFLQRLGLSPESYTMLTRLKDHTSAAWEAVPVREGSVVPDIAGIAMGRVAGEEEKVVLGEGVKKQKGLSDDHVRRLYDTDKALRVISRASQAEREQAEDDYYFIVRNNPGFRMQVLRAAGLPNAHIGMVSEVLKSEDPDSTAQMIVHRGVKSAALVSFNKLIGSLHMEQLGVDHDAMEKLLARPEFKAALQGEASSHELHLLLKDYDKLKEAGFGENRVVHRMVNRFVERVLRQKFAQDDTTVSADDIGSFASLFARAGADESHRLYAVRLLDVEDKELSESVRAVFNRMPLPHRVDIGYLRDTITPEVLEEIAKRRPGIAKVVLEDQHVPTDNQRLMDNIPNLLKQARLTPGSVRKLFANVSDERLQELFGEVSAEEYRSYLSKDLQVEAAQEDVTGAPEDVTGTPEDVTGAPEDVTGTPEDVTGAPEDAAGSSEDAAAGSGRVSAGEGTDATEPLGGQVLSREEREREFAKKLVRSVQAMSRSGVLPAFLSVKQEDELSDKQIDAVVEEIRAAGIQVDADESTPLPIPIAEFRAKVKPPMIISLYNDHSKLLGAMGIGFLARKTGSTGARLLLTEKRLKDGLDALPDELLGEILRFFPQETYDKHLVEKTFWQRAADAAKSVFSG